MSSSLVFAVGLLISGYGPPQPWEFTPPLPPGARIIGPVRTVQPAQPEQPDRPFDRPAPLTQAAPEQQAAPAEPDAALEPEGARSTAPSVIPDVECKDCTDGTNLNCLPKVVNPNHVCEEVLPCAPIAPPEAHGDLRRIDGGTIEPCIRKTTHTGTIKTPAEVVYTVKTIKIGKHTYRTKCCEYEVCIPVQEVCKKTIKCEIRDYPGAKLEVCHKPNGRYDVYVYGISGMPDGWVYLADATKAEVNGIPAFSPPLP